VGWDVNSISSIAYSYKKTSRKKEDSDVITKKADTYSVPGKKQTREHKQKIKGRKIETQYCDNC
jgi:hypothetical protein